MWKTRLLSSAAAVVMLGSIDLAGAPPLSARSYECFICVPPPIMCLDHYEYDDDCQAFCQGYSRAQDCPYNDPSCGSPVEVRVDCLPE